MSKKSTVQGSLEIQRELAARVKGNAKGMKRGLLKAGLFLQRLSMQIVPVDLNVLRPSANTRAEGSGKATSVIVSYGTDYAVYVHEDLEARHAPGKQAKFLEQPFREKKDRLKRIVMEEIKKG